MAAVDVLLSQGPTVTAFAMVTGAAGDLGRALMLAPQHESFVIQPRTHQDLDISDMARVHREIQRWQPSIIINAANRVAVAGEHRASAVEFATTNYLGPAVLADVTRMHGVQLIQPIRPYRSLGGIADWPHVHTVMVDVLGGDLAASVRAIVRKVEEIINADR